MLDLKAKTSQNSGNKYLTVSVNRKILCTFRNNVQVQVSAYLKERFRGSSIFLLLITSPNSPYLRSTLPAASRDQQFGPVNLHSGIRSAFAKIQPQHLLLAYTAVVLESPTCIAHNQLWSQITTVQHTFPSSLLISTVIMLNSAVQLSPRHHTITFQVLTNDGKHPPATGQYI